MNLLELAIKVFVDNDEANKGLDDTENKALGMAKKIGGGLATAARVGAAAVGVAATSIAAVTKQAVSAYGEYEQLSGGIETLYKNSASQMMQYANNAYKTAGMSVNEYMETAIQSSAAMISSLGGDTAKAAEMTDMAITDMSDNVNKMGTTMESIQNAYKGFSRGNFTMLDNLALGFAGTKEGMQELLDKAKEISGVEYNIDSYADIVQAIHVVQTEMGITGTTAKEGADTITGSLATVKAAWQNLVTGFANPDANLGQLIDDLVSNAEVAFKNLIPTIQNALVGIANFLSNITPIIAERLPGFIQEILPPLLSAALQLITALAENLPTMMQILVDQAPNIIQTLIDAILQSMPMVISLGVEVLLALINGIANALPELIPVAVDVILTIVDTLINNIDLLVDASIALIMGLAEGLIIALPRLIEKIPEIVEKLVDAFVRNAPKLFRAAGEIMVQLAIGIIEFIPKLYDATKQVISTIAEFLGGLPEMAKGWGQDLIMGFIDGILKKWNDLKETVSGMAATVKDYLGFSEPKKGPLSNFHTYAPDMMELFAKGVKDNEDLITYQLDKSFDFGNSIVPEKTITNKESNTKDKNVVSDQNIVVNVELEGIASEILRVVKQEAKKIYNSSGYNTIVYGG